MKKYTLYFILITLIVILLNLFFNITIFRNQISFQHSILSGQAESCVKEIESSLLKFENEVNALLYSNSLINVNLSSDDANQEGLRNLELLFSNNSKLIKNLYIYDVNKNVLNMSFNKRNRLLIDPYITQKQNELQDKVLIKKIDDGYQYIFPIFKENLLTANLVFSIDLPGFFQELFTRYFHDEAFWQWVVDSNGKTLYSNAVSSTMIQDTLRFKDKVLSEQSGFFKHNIQYNNKDEKLYSAFSSLSIMNDRFGVIFSMRKAFIFDLILNKVIASGILSTLIMLLFLMILLGKMGKSLSMKEKTSTELSNLQSIFDNLPVGIMVINQEQQVKIINQTARDMLLMNQDESPVGKNLTDRFMLSKDYYDSGNDNSFDSNQFVIYRHEGEEVAVFKKDLPYIIDNEEFLLSAFVDVTPIEKARKYEAASNTAKSEFLAKMSHEIRTPMNGIIGMTEALDQEHLTPNQKEYVHIVKRSADVLLTLIDDILDFSKIEAGKMQLEEIPFKLREEVKLSVDLFKPIIEDKKLTLSLKINPDVPENIIGDPFRLRQVLSNLISNAVKFTHEGEISVGVELEEEYNNNLTLVFYVEDTGVGIPRNKIESIFNSFTQAEESTSRKYGGSGLGTTIAKQLVTLMHGEIWVQSPSSISRKPAYPGSKFSFTIEVYSNEKILKPLNLEKINSFSQVNVLIITSFQQSNSRLIRFCELQKFKYEIFEFVPENLDELKDRLKENNVPYQVLIILDDPGMNGFLITKKLQDNGLTDLFFILMISSNHKSENYVQAKRLGVDCYFPEPVEQSELIKCLHDSFPNVEKDSTEVLRVIKPDLTILVAEDNEINIRVAQTIFSNLGFKIDVAKNGNEAIEKVKTKNYDLIFMDLVMPERDGIQATVEMRGLGYQMPIIAMTATASSKTKSKAIASGMNDYITKPVKIESLRNILIKWFA